MTNTIIAISGLAGTGKTTVGKIVSKYLNYQFIAPTFKDIAKEKHISLLKFQKLAENDAGSIDRAFDNHIKLEMKKGNSVIATWLGPWLAKENRNTNVFRIWLTASDKVRISRIAHRDNISFSTARRRTIKREASNKQRYMKYYRIDLDDLSIFDLCINTDHLKPNKIADIILCGLKARFPRLRVKN